MIHNKKLVRNIFCILSTFILSSCLLELHGTTFYESKPWIQFTPKEKLSVPIDELINAPEYITIESDKFRISVLNQEKHRYDKYSYEKNPIYFSQIHSSNSFDDKKVYDYLIKENIKPTKAWFINILDDKYFETSGIYKDKSIDPNDVLKFYYKFDSPKDPKGYFNYQFSNFYSAVQFESNNRKFILKNFTNYLPQETLDYIKKEVKNENN